MVSLNIYKNSANKFIRKTGFKIENEVKFDLEGQGQSPPKTIGILTKVFYTYGPNLVILAWTGDELSRGQASDYRTHGRTDTQTDAGNDNTRRPKLASGNNALSKIRKIFTGLMYKLLVIFIIISGVYRSFIPKKPTFTKYCLTKWISKLPGSFENHWVRQYLLNFTGLASIVYTTAKKEGVWFVATYFIGFQYVN